MSKKQTQYLNPGDVIVALSTFVKVLSTNDTGITGYRWDETSKDWSTYTNSFVSKPTREHVILAPDAVAKLFPQNRHGKG